MSEKEPKKTLSMMERYKVMGYIEIHCLKGPGEKYAVWDSSAKSDQHVADVFKPSVPNLSAHHVTRMRQEMDLMLEPARWTTQIGVTEEIRDAIAELRAGLALLEEQTEATFLKLNDRIALLEGRNTNPK